MTHSTQSVNQVLASLSACDRMRNMRCGVVAGQVFGTLTGRSPLSLDDADVRSKKRGAKPFDIASVRLPPPGGLQVVGVSLVNHQMTFAITSDGQVHTLQTYHPLIREPQQWSMNFAVFKGALRRLCEHHGKQWDAAYAAAFCTLTRVDRAWRDFSLGSGIEGFVTSTDPIPGAEHIGKMFLNGQLSRKTYTSISGVVAMVA